MRPEPAAAWIGRAPGRVNLIGEHVDYLGGLVLPCAIDRHTEVEGRPAQEWSVESAVDGGLPYVRALGEQLGAAPQAVRVRSTVRPGSGLSSSAALLVAMARGLRPDLGGREAALACQAAEQRATGVRVGIMDQFASALGRRGHALLLDCAILEYRLVPFPDQVAICVLDSGVHRRLADTPYNRRRAEAEAGHPARRRHVEGELVRVREFADALEAGDLGRLGALLAASHASLRDDMEVSSPELERVVAAAGAAPGCLGARLLGAGFGGSVLALVERSRLAGFTAALRVPVEVCATADGAFAA